MLWQRREKVDFEDSWVGIFRKLSTVADVELIALPERRFLVRRHVGDLGVVLESDVVRFFSEAALRLQKPRKRIIGEDVAIVQDLKFLIIDGTREDVRVRIERRAVQRESATKGSVPDLAGLVVRDQDAVGRARRDRLPRTAYPECARSA